MKIQNSNGKKMLPLILIIGFIIILLSVIIVVLLNQPKNSNTPKNEVTQEEQNKDNKPKEDDELLKEIEKEKNKDKEEKIEINKEYLKKDGVSIKDLFDSTGDEAGKLHIGDFVDYTAGNWTEKEINDANANGELSKPTDRFQFGGYNEGYSRDRSVVPLEKEYSFIKELKEDGSGKRAVRGWRIFDITDKEIVLISAGCPEDYYHPESKKSAYISEYILTGEVNSNANAEWLELGTTYKARNWKEYLNSDFYAIKANTLTKKQLDDWYKKYITKEDSDIWVNTTLQKVYDTKYENLIDNYGYYWLSSPYSETNLYGFFPSAKAIGNSTNVYGNVFGIRVLVYLPGDIKFKEEPIGTKKITSREKDYEYNIWEISR